MGLFNRHQHRWLETYSGCWADVPGGPRSMHLIHWECIGCGKRLGDQPDYRAFDPGETLEMREGRAARKVGLGPVEHEDAA